MWNQELTSQINKIIYYFYKRICLKTDRQEWKYRQKICKRKVKKKDEHEEVIKLNVREDVKVYLSSWTSGKPFAEENSVKVSVVFSLWHVSDHQRTEQETGEQREVLYLN